MALWHKYLLVMDGTLGLVFCSNGLSLKFQSINQTLFTQLHDTCKT